MNENVNNAVSQEYPYLETLNPEQREAVERVDGPLLVLAGAGTGKTRVLTARIAHLLISGKAMPGEILAVTFTNKAAREMTHRVESLIGGSAAGVWLGTFHSIGARILRRHAERVGLQPNFTIVDADDQHRLVKQLMEEMNIDHKRFPGKVALALIQSWKDKGLTPDKVNNARGSDYADGKLPALYKRYQERLLQLNAADFGDLILHCLTLFSDHPDVLQQFHARFRYILVDEYQDTNVSQYLWLRLLAMSHHNLCCVGDDDQSIYSWRGAEVGNILRFEKDFPEAHVIRLEENYRSTPHILGAASKLIAHNQERLGKTLRTPLKEGEKLFVRSVWDDREEALSVADQIEDLQRDGHDLNEIAILVRASFQTRNFEEMFIQRAIPYRVIGGLKFYERKEIRDILAYLRITVQLRHDLGWERIINVPKRGVGAATLERLSMQARADNSSLYDAITYQLEKGELKGRAKDALAKLTGQFREWQRMLDPSPSGERMSAAEVTERILEESGYMDMLRTDKTPESQTRMENLSELLRQLAHFESVQAFLDHTALVTDLENNANQADDSMVTLMTMHAAKGLEFDTVFLPGWEEGLFPHQRALDEEGRKGLEEERRLAYVGITRARKRAVISHASNRLMRRSFDGQSRFASQPCIPSRFIDELPPEHVEVTDGNGAPPSHGFGGRAGGDSLQRQIDAIFASSNVPSVPPRTDRRQRTKLVESESGSIRTGDRVTHGTFGKGQVVAIQDGKLTICFETAGIKKLMPDYVQKV